MLSFAVVAGTDSRFFGQATLSKRLRQAQARIDEVLAEKQRSEQGLVVKLTSSQRLHQAAFQREQQLR